MKKKILIIFLILLSFVLMSCENSHTHQYIDGLCSCGEEDPNYKPPHIHIYENGKCECGEKDPNYKPPHTHAYENGKCECGEKDPNYEEIKYKIIFKDYDGEILLEVIIFDGENITLPDSPKREGYIFVGWDNNLENVNNDLIVNAIYEKEPLKVGKDEKYHTLEEAMNVASDGDIIYISEGTYEGTTINKQVEIRGSNYNINPNKERNNESTFISDIVINESNVKINGIELTDKAKITFDNLQSNVENINISHCKITNSTVNSDNNRDIAPFNLKSNNGFVIKNIIIDSCYINKVDGGRPMGIYIVDAEDITISNCTFNGGNNRGSYNDCIKVDNKENGNAEFGVRGNVIIKNNIFKNYSQYAIWFRQYSNGNYIIENNYFENIGQTNDAHAAINFIAPINCTNININVLNNEIVKGYMLFRIDEINNDLQSFNCIINENCMINCSGKYYIKNSTGYNINAKNNYYGTSNVKEDKFLGSIDYSNYYINLYDIPGHEMIQLNYDTTPYVNVSSTIKINYECFGFEEGNIKWSSSNENIAVVNEYGEVTGIKVGAVDITAVVEEFGIIEAITVMVYESSNDLDEVTNYVLSIMNSYSYAVTAANSRTNYGVTNPYLYSIYRGATKYLFEDLVIDTESYPRNGSAPLVNNKVEYITIHDTWAMPRTAKGLAEYFQKDITSVHYTVGNDGIYQIVRLTDKAAHAGDSPYRAYALEKTNVLATTDNPKITMIDGYFAINGIKTNLRPYTDYDGTIQDKTNYTTDQITYSGIRCLIGEDGYYYLGKTYFNDTYKTISNFGGNANSIGMEMESQKGTDFYWNMQRTAKLVAMLMDKFNLTTNDVKMHNYFSGKNCAQLLKNNLKYEYNYQIDKHNMEDTLWDEFLELCDVELKMLRYSKYYKFEFLSSDTELLTNTGRVINHRLERQTVKYTIKITNIMTGEIIELNSAIIIPSSLEIDPCYITKR